MRLAILGATSQIAKDLISLFVLDPKIKLSLFARNLAALDHWLSQNTSRTSVRAKTYAEFQAATSGSFDAVLNFVGSGNPALTATLGKEIWDITQQFDAIAMNYISRDPTCRYIFISSGAIFGGDFSTPVTADTVAFVQPNSIRPDAWYGLAKLNTEISHRRFESLAIVDLRVFNYFSYSADMEARFLITDALRAIQTRTILRTTKSNIWRDYIGPQETAQIVERILYSAPQNVAVDCFSKSPVDKLSMLERMQNELGLQYEFVNESIELNATGSKSHYYSKNQLASRVFGYFPNATAIEIVMRQAQQLLSRAARASL